MFYTFSCYRLHSFLSVIAFLTAFIYLVEARELQISPEPSQYSNGGTFVVNLSELLSHDSFYNIDALHVQLEIGAPSWAFQRQDTTRNTRNYFVGLTSDGNARISLLRRNAKIDLNTGSHVTGVIQDMTRGFWYEIKPNVKGTSVVTTILDREIAPFADPIVPKIHQEKMKQTKQTNNAQQKKQQLPQEENFEGFPAPAPGKAQPIEHRKQLFRDQQSTSSWLQSARKLVNSWILPWGRISASPWNDVGEDTVVDIMVVWTKSAECIKSYLSANCTVSTQTRQNMKLSILFFLQETNMAFANSGINLRLNLIHEQRVLYEETTMDKYPCSTSKGKDTEPTWSCCSWTKRMTIRKQELPTTTTITSTVPIICTV